MKVHASKFLNDQFLTSKLLDAHVGSIGVKQNTAKCEVTCDIRGKGSQNRTRRINQQFAR